MLIKSIKLNDYRNYDRFSTTLDPHLNIIVGKNGSGKTNLLESVVVTCNAKSFRTQDDQDLIKKEKEFLKIETESDENNFKIIINKNNKSLYINNELIKKTSNYIGKLNSVLFIPSDLNLFDDAPSERRRVLDLEIGKINKNYLRNLLEYNSLLKDKNKLLKEINIDKNLLQIIEDSMIPKIKVLIEERDKFIEGINNYISGYYSQISGQQQTIKLIYKKCCEVEEIQESILEAKDKDLINHCSTFGPHRDDFSFLISGDDVNSIASQGQKRMIMIAFKFSLMKYIENNINTTPILLLDDILSELDEDNQERLLNTLPKSAQVIITNTDIKNININESYKLIEVDKEEQYV